MKDMEDMEDMEAASGSLMEKPMQDLPQNAQEAQGREALVPIQAL
jgi:hypothetical protein